MVRYTWRDDWRLERRDDPPDFEQEEEGESWGEELAYDLWVEDALARWEEELGDESA